MLIHEFCDKLQIPFEKISSEEDVYKRQDLFFWACKDTAAKFVYTFPDGREETLVIEY